MICDKENSISRLSFLKKSAAVTVGLMCPEIFKAQPHAAMITRKIPSSGELIPAIGLGSWITFNVGDSENELAPMRNVLRAFVDAGGKVIDSSPMYGRSEKVIGKLATELNATDKLWFATKVWTTGEKSGKTQIENSKDYFKTWPALLQVHNLQDLKTHLRTLRTLKEDGKLKYIGITHYLDSQHETLANLVKSEKLDFVQVNFSVRSRLAENYLLPLASDRGVAVIINKPFESGELFPAVTGVSLPAWSKEWGITSWPAFFLKYILSNKNITCTIPATSQVSHLKENMAACFGPLPDEAARKKMVDYFVSNAR